MHVESSLRKWPHLEHDLIGTKGNLGGKVFIRSGRSGGKVSGGKDGGGILVCVMYGGRCMVCGYMFTVGLECGNIMWGGV